MANDIEKYIEKRKQSDTEFAEDFESGYISFKIGVILAQARENAGITLKELANRLNIDESTVLRIESNPEDVGILTLEKFVKALGKTLSVEIK
jgi:ribosome-binding protein aMBF1 (putative translation factor)